MSLQSHCTNPACKRRYVFPSGSAGRSVRCNVCGQTFIAGGSATVDAAKAPNLHEPASGPTPSPAAPSLPASLTATGNTVGRFVIRGKLGAGAFGTVYRAYDPQLDRVVALKVPNPGVMSEAKRVERFLREAKATANLRHPHIVPVFDAGQDGDTYYIASAFIDGQPLADGIPEAGTDFARAARLVRELAEALAYAHEQGIVHRDVKPQNVMLDKQDRVHLMDFGLAARQDEEAKLTNDGAVMGTPAYMSPEQARGQQGEAQPATDQYAAGVVLYELLTGRVPFSGPLPVVMHNVIHTEPNPPHKSRAGVPTDLETVCLKAMAKRPEDRYPDCQALADDLRRWLEGEPVAARRMGLAERAARWVKKEPKVSAAAAVVALVLLVSVGLVSAAARRAERDAADARAAEKKAEDALADSRAAEKRAENALEDAKAARKRAEDAQTAANAAQTAAKGAQASADKAKGATTEALGTAAQERQKADDADARAADEQKKANALRAMLGADRHALQFAYQAQLDGRPADANTLLEMVPADRRGWEWRHVRFLLAPPGEAAAVRKWAVISDSHRGRITFSRDGKMAVFSGLNRVFDAHTGKELCALESQAGTLFAAAFSPSGGRLVTAVGPVARIWDAKTGKELLTLNRHPEQIRGVAFSPGGARVATASLDRTARIWDAGVAGEPLVLKHAAGVYAVAFSPDGKQVVTTTGDGTARVWDAATGTEMFSCKSHSHSAASFSPENTQVLTAEFGTPHLWNAKTGKELFALNGKLGVPVVAEFSTDGAWVVAAGPNGPVLLWDAKTGKEGAAIKGHPGGPAALSADGARLVAAGRDHQLRVWDARRGGDPLLTIPLLSRVTSVAWHPDGSKLFCIYEDGTLEVRDSGPDLPPAGKP